MEGARYLETLRTHMTAVTTFVRNRQFSKVPGTSIGFDRLGDGGEARLRAIYRQVLRQLDDPQTKRMLFDSRQALLFDELHEPVPSSIQGKLHAPFDQFYLEFTEPVVIGEMEPGVEGEPDRLRAMLYTSDVADITIPYTPPDADEPVMNTYTALAQLNFFLEAADGGLVERSFLFHLGTGLAFTRVSTALSAPDPSEIPEHWIDADPNAYIPADMPFNGLPHTRHVGWWERTCAAYGDLFSWMLAYTMAKSIRITAEPMSRPQKRWHKRKGITPNPWHVIQVEPRFMQASPEGEPTGRQHSYRYDVIGHLRFGKHKRGDGTYSETIEWVAPHQRGLQHARYVPATHKVARGKVIAPAMQKYFGQEVPTNA